MNLVAAWLLVPATLALICGGLGLLAERAAGVTLPGTLVPGVGLCCLIVIAGLATTNATTCHVAFPAVLVAAIGGIAWARPWQDPRLKAFWPWPLLAALAGFLAIAAPSLLSGQGMMGGYVKLDDSATWLALTDRAFSHGRSLGLAPSSYERTLATWMGSGYPLGAFMPLGIGARSGGVDVAAAYQPDLAVMASIVSLSLATCARELVRAKPLACIAGGIGVQASLYVGYVQWGGIKEATTAALIVTGAALVGVAGGRFGAIAAKTKQTTVPMQVRALPLLGITAGSLLCTLGVNGLTWAGPLALAGLAVAIVAAVQTERRQLALITLAIGAFTVVLCSLPALLTTTFLRNTTNAAGSLGSDSNDLGNLVGPIKTRQGFGLYPDGDFRFAAPTHVLTSGLAWMSLLLALAAVGWAVYRRTWAIPTLVLGGGLGTVIALHFGGPWVDAKALAITAPALLGAGAALVLSGLERDDLWPAAAAPFAVALVGGAIWSSVLINRDVEIAPHERLAELHTIAGKIGKQGPTVVLDFEIYADRHFLRDADPEGATDLRERQVAKTDGTLFPSLSSAEVDQVATPDLFVYRTIVRRRTPVGSRPPTAYNRIWAGPSFEVWQRPATASAPVIRLPLGDTLDPSAAIACSQVARVAHTPGVTSLAAVPRTPPVLADVATAQLPAGWAASQGAQPLKDGTARVTVTVPSAGRYRVWVGGSVFGTLQVKADGQGVGSKHHELAHDGQWLRYGVAQLKQGTNVVELKYTRGGIFDAGRQQASAQTSIGPLAVTALADDQPQAVERVPAAQYDKLCDGRQYDWIEGLR